MTEIVLVRSDAAPISEHDAAAARKVLFGQVDGLSEQHRKSWRRLWNWFLKSAEPGEMVEIKTHRERSGPFHRRHFKIEQTLFNSQERFEHFDQYLYWIKVGAGWVIWAAGPSGGVVPIPRSVSYAKAEEDEFQEFHARVMQFLRGPHAARYLWPHLKEGKAEQFMDEILRGFEE